MKCEICDSCFSKAIAAEKTVQAYYEKMAEYFTHVPILQEFLTVLSLDEFKHAESLRESKKAKYHSDKIHAEADKMERRLGFIMEDVQAASKSAPASFEETYLFARDLENAELNTSYASVTGTPSIQ